MFIPLFYKEVCVRFGFWIGTKYLMGLDSWLMDMPMYYNNNSNRSTDVILNLWGMGGGGLKKDLTFGNYVHKESALWKFYH